MNESLIKLLAWINTHDCGVIPCGILREEEGAIDISVAVSLPCGTEDVEITRVHNMAEAREALGY